MYNIHYTYWISSYLLPLLPRFAVSRVIEIEKWSKFLTVSIIEPVTNQKNMKVQITTTTNTLSDEVLTRMLTCVSETARYWINMKSFIVFLLAIQTNMRWNADKSWLCTLVKLIRAEISFVSTLIFTFLYITRWFIGCANREWQIPPSCKYSAILIIYMQSHGKVVARRSLTLSSH